MFDQTLFKKKKIVCLGLLTADMYVHPIEISDLKELVSDTYEIEEFMISVGGDASNQAIALSQLGANVTLLAKTGDDSLGLLMADQIFAKGIKTKQGFVEKGRNTSVSIVCVDKAGQRFFLHKKGNNNIWSLDEIELDFCNMQDAFLSIGSLGGLDGIMDDGTLMYLQKLRERGCTVFADMTADIAGIGVEALLRMLSAVDYFLPSMQEARMLTGEDDPVKAIQILKHYVDGEIVIKLGDEGCIVGTEEIIPAYTVSPVDTTGAGDNFVAGFMCGIACNGDLTTAAQFGNITGALSTTRIGTHALSYSLTELIETTKRYYGNENIT